MLRPKLLRIPPSRCISLQPLNPSFICLRQTSLLHTDVAANPTKPRVPPPRPDIPDVKTFLERIGRNAASECEDKIRTWKELFLSDGEVMKKKEIPARLRRYILLQTEKYRNGEAIMEIKRGRKVGGGERRRNKGVTKTKLSR